MVLGILLLVIALLLCAGFVIAFASYDKDNFPPGLICFFLMIVVSIASVFSINESAEGYPVYYSDINGLTSGNYRVVSVFEDNGRPYVAAVKDGEDKVKVYALYEPLPPQTKRIKVDTNKDGPEMISVENLAEDSGQK